MHTGSKCGREVTVLRSGPDALFADPGGPVGTTCEFRATTQHAGRSLWLTDVAGTVDGKVCTTARVTAQGSS